MADAFPVMKDDQLAERIKRHILRTQIARDRLRPLAQDEPGEFLKQLADEYNAMRDEATAIVKALRDDTLR